MKEKEFKSLNGYPVKDEKARKDIANSFRKNYKNIKEYGCVGDGITDDTTKFLQCIQDHKFIYIPKGTYILDLEEVDLNDIEIIGDGENDSILVQNKADYPMFHIGENVKIKDIQLKCEAVNTTQTPMIVMLRGFIKDVCYPVTGSLIERVKIVGKADNELTNGIYFNTNDYGSHGLTMKDIDISYLRNCFMIVDENKDTTGYLTGCKFENFNISKFILAAMYFKSTNKKSQVSHNSFNNFTIHNINYATDQYGLRLNFAGNTFNNLCMFNDNDTNVFYSIEFSENYSNEFQTNNNTFIGGVIEGKLLNRKFMSYNKFIDVKIIDRENSADVTATFLNLQNTVLKNYMPQHIILDACRNIGQTMLHIGKGLSYEMGRDSEGNFIKVMRDPNSASSLCDFFFTIPKQRVSELIKASNGYFSAFAKYTKSKAEVSLGIESSGNKVETYKQVESFHDFNKSMIERVAQVGVVKDADPTTINMFRVKLTFTFEEEDSYVKIYDLKLFDQMIVNVKQTGLLNCVQGYQSKKPTYLLKTSKQSNSISFSDLTGEHFLVESVIHYNTGSYDSSIDDRNVHVEDFNLKDIKKTVDYEVSIDNNDVLKIQFNEAPTEDQIIEIEFNRFD